MISTDLESITSNKQFLNDHLAMVMFLENSKLLSYLRGAGLRSLQNSLTDVNVAALSGSYAAGWQACLDLLVDFKDIVIRPLLEVQDNPRADFGSLDKAVADGDLTKEEADAIRSGNTPTYTDHNGLAIAIKSSTTI